MPTRILTKVAASCSCTTASSRTISSLRAQLEEKGHVFQSQTDTEVLAHLIGAAFERRSEKYPSRSRGGGA